MKSILSFFAIFFLSSVTFAQLQTPQPGLECRYIYAIEQAFLSQHVKITTFDKTLQTRTVEQYVKHLDPTKVYLTQADVDEVKKMMGDVFDQTKNKDCSVRIKPKAKSSCASISISKSRITSSPT